MEKLVETDANGRLTLGKNYAHMRFLVEEENGLVRLTKAIVISEHEAWLLKNPEAKKSIKKGLADSKAGRTKRDAIDLDKYEF